MTGGPLLAAVVGLGAVATLVALQRLRPRPARRMVATLQFWPAVARSQDRRTLGGRFGRVGSFLMVLAVLLLLAAALSGWTWRTQTEPLALVIDTGYTMTARHSGRTRLADAVALADADLLRLGQTPVTVLSAGPSPRVLDNINAPAGLVRRRLTGLIPAAAPGDAAAALTLAADLLPPGQGRVLWYTDRPTLPPGLPASVSGRVERHPVGSSAANSAIVSASFTTGAEKPYHGTLCVGVTSWGEPAEPLRVRIATGGTAVKEVGIDDHGVATFEDLRTDGTTLALELVGDTTGIASDDHATVRLPTRRPLRFRLDAPVAPALLAALDTMGAVVSGDNYDVYIGDRPDGGKPSVCVVSGGSAVASGSRVSTGAAGESSFESAVTGAGAAVEERNATPLLRTASAVLAAIGNEQHPTLWLSNALFAPGSTVPNRPAFFVLLEDAVRGIAGQTREAAVSFPLSTISAGQPTPPDVAVGDLRQADRTLKDGRALPAATWQPWEWLLIGAFIATAIEAMLYVGRRIV